MLSDSVEQRDSQSLSSWPVSFYVDDLDDFADDGVLPVVLRTASDTRLAIAVPLYITRQRPWLPNDNDVVTPSNDDASSFTQPIEITDSRSVAVYSRSQHGQFYSLVENPLIRLTPFLHDAVPNRCTLSANNRPHNCSTLAERRYLMIRADLWPHYSSSFCVELVVLLRTGALGPYPSFDSSPLLRLSLWKRFWERQEQLRHPTTSSSNGGHWKRAVAYYRSAGVSVCKESSLFYPKMLSQKDRRTLRTVLIASRGRTYRLTWEREYFFFAEWKIQRVVNITKPVFQFYYGYSKVQPLTLGTDFHLRLHRHENELCVFMTARVPKVIAAAAAAPKRKSLAGQPLALPHAVDIEDVSAVSSKQIALFVMLLVGEQGEQDDPVRVVGRSQLIRFPIPGSHSVISFTWLPCLVTFLFFSTLLLIIPSTRRCVKRNLQRIARTLQRIGENGDNAPSRQYQKRHTTKQNTILQGIRRHYDSVTNRVSTFRQRRHRKISSPSFASEVDLLETTKRAPPKVSFLD